MQTYNFRIRTITAGVDLNSFQDIEAIHKTISFLNKAKKSAEDLGYEVQTTRIALPHFYKINRNPLNGESISELIKIDQICSENGVMLAIGDLLKPDVYDPEQLTHIEQLIRSTQMISFHTVIASPEQGIHENALLMAAEICHMLAKNSEGGEANFRFTASANCPPGIPYFPTAYHEGQNAFGIGLESANIFYDALKNIKWQEGPNSIRENLTNASLPLIDFGEKMAANSGRKFNGIDVSTAPGLDASIGAAIEQLTQVPFGCASTLSACSMITDVLKSLPFKTCGYSGLMLPVIEDKILAQRASEKRFTVEELLLFSAVSGTGLDVVPIPGNTSVDVLKGLYRDMASLSLKYQSKVLSARLFPIPNKTAGERVEFKNPYLTACNVMALT